ncbi:Gluconolactonase [Granulosicoccus antarcticus IMCC3135]|uniref:Gluconolactonase n=2 Tax=Granulosicoccus TaxID=437504 RepID=A0A2Z2NIH9_9GAMM|nr:Gluconolactonase [Granulosicoccus antarcticus IMCC3135]
MYGELEGCGMEVIDDTFSECFIGHARVERLWTGARWCEGPAWFAAGRYLIWSDIPNNRMLRLDEPSGHVSVFRNPSQNSNGNTVDRQGRLVSCEHLTRRVTRTEHDGSVSVLASEWQGKRLNSPNDVVVKSDGSVWFTDPSYGIMTDYEGDSAESELPCQVYRIDPDGSLSVVAEDFVKPNGLAFSLDESILYVSDTGVSHMPGGPRHIRALVLSADGRSVTGSSVFAECSAGLFDGFRVDCNGRLWCSAEDGVHCIDPSGKLIGKVHIPEIVSNVTFGGPKRNRLFICGTTSIYSLYLAINGSTPG